MPLDAICISALKNELSERVIGMKIEQVHQPDRDTLILSLRGPAAAPCRLLLSGHSGAARIHLTEHRFENPMSPPMFCMLLRKHLAGARLTGISQPAAERVLELELQTSSAMGVMSAKRLIAELIGQSPNIILVGDDNIIIDCLRRTGDGMNITRAALPGLIYRAPPPQEGKRNPLELTETEWQAAFDASAGHMAADKWLLKTFSALSPLICRELSQRAYGDTDIAADDGGEALKREFFALINKARAGEFEPWLITAGGGTPKDYSYTRITQYGSAFTLTRDESFQAMLEGFYTRSEQLARVRRSAGAMTKTVENARGRLVRKLASQKQELAETDKRDSLRECGDIITANLHLMKKGMERLSAPDFYSEDGGLRDIKLDPLKTPQQNAARYYKEYTKAKNAEKFLTEQIRLGESELNYLESVVEEIRQAGVERDLTEIRRELTGTGYIREKKKEKGKPAESAPREFTSTEGLTILAGRNNTQNDALTLKKAAKHDMWFHAQKLHGSHVILVCGGAEPDGNSIMEAASIAAYYSSGRDAGKVPVDCTLVKNVKKPPGGRPGAVIYTDYKTIIAEPRSTL